MDNSQNILDKARSKGWALIAYDDSVTVSVNVPLKDAEAFFNELPSVFVLESPQSSNGGANHETPLPSEKITN